MLPVVAAKVAEVAAAGTLTDVGAVSVEFVFVRVTVAPPAVAAFVRVTEHVLEALGPKLVGLHAREDTRTEATRLTVVLAELLL